MKTEKAAFSTKEAAENYNTTPGTLANLRSQLKGPKFYKAGRKILYFREDLEAYFRRSPVLTRDCLEK